jgi:sporulation protein YlmC with PRC-barrel domain
MRNEAQSPDTSELSYLDASSVTSPAGVLSQLDVLSVEGRRLGNIEGVVIDAAARHVRYLSIRLSRWFGSRRCLVPVDQLGQIESDRNALRLRSDLRDDVVRGLDAGAFRKFSDEDAIAAIFAPRAA